MTKITLTPLTEDDREQFILDNQLAFKYGAMEEFGERDDHFEEDGEITVKGPALFLGYFGEAPVDRNAFFPTGDLGYLDEKGFLHITGRKKDIIIRNGNNISSRAIEQKLLSLPFIANAAVVGVTDPDCGEVPVAMVVVREGETYDRAAVAAVLSKPEMPREVRMVNDLPLNATGKIDKQKIKELFS